VGRVEPWCCPESGSHGPARLSWLPGPPDRVPAVVQDSGRWKTAMRRGTLPLSESGGLAVRRPECLERGLRGLVQIPWLRGPPERVPPAADSGRRKTSMGCHRPATRRISGSKPELQCSPLSGPGAVAVRRPECPESGSRGPARIPWLRGPPDRVAAAAQDSGRWRSSMRRVALFLFRTLER